MAVVFHSKHPSPFLSLDGGSRFPTAADVKRRTANPRPYRAAERHRQKRSRTTPATTYFGASLFGKFAVVVFQATRFEPSDAANQNSRRRRVRTQSEHIHVRIVQIRTQTKRYSQSVVIKIQSSAKDINQRINEYQKTNQKDRSVSRWIWIWI